ncbi:hypothetical protein EOD39_21276 [Acipenser ruthenus]|uniref:Uncharacterized protein n=1 Tax=Acipenser ruthenus TaxID=7906 RepID=A0A444UT44_ACIRT|nr:hypothetical protein EOD39_21276 [Acipenser ruthenus]
MNPRVQDNLLRKQEKSKAYTDVRRRAKVPVFKQVDYVRVRKPEHVKKRTAKFTDPVRVQRKIGPSTYVLGDGKTWNASHLTLYLETALVSQTEVPRATEQCDTTPTSPVRSKPIRRPSAWQEDFVK